MTIVVLAVPIGRVRPAVGRSAQQFRRALDIRLDTAVLLLEPA